MNPVQSMVILFLGSMLAVVAPSELFAQSGSERKTVCPYKYDSSGLPILSGAQVGGHDCQTQLRGGKPHSVCIGGTFKSGYGCFYESAGTTGDNLTRSQQTDKKNPEASANTRSAAAPNQQQAISECAGLVQKQMQACNDGYQNLVKTCNAENDSGVQSATTAAAVAAQALNAQAQSSIQAACSGMAKAAQGAQAAVAALSFSCDRAKDSCISSCREARSAVQKCQGSTAGFSDTAQAIDGYYGSPEMTIIDRNLDECSQVQTAFKQSSSQLLAGLMSSSNTNKQCAALNAASSKNAYCQAFGGSDPICANQGPVNCSAPDQASTQFCICATNPASPNCANVNSKLSQGWGNAIRAGGGGSSAGGSDKSLNGIGDIGLGDSLDFQQLPNKESGPTEDVGGKQGTGAGLAAGGNPLGNNLDKQGGPGGYSGEDNPMAVNAGYYAGGGGGGGSSYRPSSGASSYNPYNPKSPQYNGPNLRDFLPNGKFDPKRGTAGEAGIDGITGPNTDIWQKMHNRYQALRSTFLQ
ncbi:MAG: hypothetical protein ACOYOK_00395 [Pseudobdellovibrionaceae bacterium]